MLTEDTLATIAEKHGVVTSRFPKGRGEAVASIAFAALEVNLGALGAGYVNGRYTAPGKDHADMPGMGTPVDLTMGVLGVAASLLGTFGPFDGHVANVAIGSLAAYTARMGLAYGAAAKAKSLQLANQKVAGAIDAASTSSTNVTPIRTTAVGAR